MPFKMLEDGVKKYTCMKVVYEIESVVIIMRPLTIDKVCDIFKETVREHGDIFEAVGQKEKKETRSVTEIIEKRIDNPNLLTIILSHILIEKEANQRVSADFVKKNFTPELYKEVWNDFTEINEKKFLIEQVVPFIIAMVQRLKEQMKEPEGKNMKEQDLTKLAGKKAPVSSQLTE